MKVTLGYDRQTDPNAGTIDPSLATSTGNAYPTNRLLDGSMDHGYAEEWGEPCTLPDGRQCIKYYLFDDDDMEDADGEPLDPADYPWNDQHVSWIQITEDPPSPVVVGVDMFRGPIGGYGFRSGYWTATTNDGRKFRFYGSIPHVDGLNEERMITVAQSALDNNDNVEWQS